MNPTTSPETPAAKWEVYDFRRIRGEILFELLFVLVCAIAAFTWHQKIVLMAVVACFKFAMPSWMTARIVFKLDPNRWHGLGLACLFTAWGFTRVAFISFGILIGTVSTMMWLEQRGLPIDWAEFGLGICFTCVFASIIAVFPLCLAAFLIARYTQTPLYFAAGLTRLRRAKAKDRDKIKLEIGRSIKGLGYSSMVSLAVWSVILAIVGIAWLKLPDPALGIFALFSMTALPIVWLSMFVSQVAPKGELV